MSTPSFRFKRFEVWHDECAMKVGTDAVLLGAWIGRCQTAALSDVRPLRRQILDIGTGSGVIALMLAQQLEGTDFHIDAIDIDEGAVRQATKNFALSPWAKHLSVHHASLQDWTKKIVFSLIVSNPPYFVDSLKNPDKGRELARHTDSLQYEELIQCSSKLLAPDGTLALILPAEAEETIIALAQETGLTLSHLTHVYSKEGKPCKRILIAFTRSLTHHSPLITDLYIEGADSPRSAQYAALTQDFYL